MNFTNMSPILGHDGRGGAPMMRQKSLNFPVLALLLTACGDGLPPEPLDMSAWPTDAAVDRQLRTAQDPDDGYGTSKRPDAPAQPSGGGCQVTRPATSGEHGLFFFVLGVAGGVIIFRRRLS